MDVQCNEFLDLAIDGDEQPALHSDLFTPGKETPSQYLLCSSVGGP